MMLDSTNDYLQLKKDTLYSPKNKKKSRKKHPDPKMAKKYLHSVIYPIFGFDFFVEILIS